MEYWSHDILDFGLRIADWINENQLSPTLKSTIRNPHHSMQNEKPRVKCIHRGLCFLIGSLTLASLIPVDSFQNRDQHYNY